mgnify:CR=1 FL=1
MLGRKIGRAAHMVLDTLLRAHTKRTLRLLGPPMLSSACSFVVNQGGAPKIEHVASSSEVVMLISQISRLCRLPDQESSLCCNFLPPDPGA